MGCESMKFYRLRCDGLRGADALPGCSWGFVPMRCGGWASPSCCVLKPAYAGPRLHLHSAFLGPMGAIRHRHIYGVTYCGSHDTKPKDRACGRGTFRNAAGLVASAAIPQRSIGAVSDESKEDPTPHPRMWDEGFFMARTDPEREPKPRPRPEPLRVVKARKLDPAAAVEAWRAIGLEVSAERIIKHNARLKEWQKAPMKKAPGIRQQRTGKMKCQQD
jgi:hypothetical protein